MRGSFLRRWLAALLALAVLGMQGPAPVLAANMETIRAVAQGGCDDASGKCGMDLQHCPDVSGCTAMVTLPAPGEATAACFNWPSLATYWPPGRLVAGRSVPPDLRPPIPFVQG